MNNKKKIKISFRHFTTSLKPVIFFYLQVEKYVKMAIYFHLLDILWTKYSTPEKFNIFEFCLLKCFEWSKLKDLTKFVIKNMPAL